MGERPLTNAERTRIQECLRRAVADREKINSYIVSMEETLQRGTIWQCDQEAFQEMCKEVEDFARRDKEESGKREDVRYGHALPRREQKGE